MIVFSIILPTYNVGQHIERCLRSCINQTYTNFEVIVVDDCGQDDAIEKAKSLMSKDSRIRIHHHEKNKGTYHARWTGVREAKGQYVVFLDPDDELELHALEELSMLIKTNPDMIFCGCREVPDKKFYQVQTVVPKIVDYKATSVEQRKLLNTQGFNLGTAGKAYKKSVIRQAFSSLDIPESVRLVYGEDVLVFSAALAMTKTIKSTQNKIYLYHQEESSITKTADYGSILKNIEQLQYVINRLEKNIVSNPDNTVAKIIHKRMSADLIKLKNKTNISSVSKIKNFVILALLTKNFRWFVKLGLYVITFGKKGT